ncbi:MHYT domain-containing protein [Caulobacter sp. 17J80-11]|uniref:MHYT domain-containing protein n=1 Tax=Caulobacter sp. 17J80-11 TaxID=2763502 RepID=UPI001653A38D|nr:MHYT domain-containing protein [Caulobacter sp. 17J80-11]MBC6980177.1 response regulator [Caulobacter sp. 17J80-11]
MPGHLGAHAPVFVLLSITVAVLGAWTALDLFRRRSGAERGRARLWLIGSAVALGLSIWSMHFIATLGWDPGTPVRYRVDLTALSLLLAIVAALGGFYALVRLHLSRWGVGLAALLMGGAVCGMHYMGVAAVQAPLRLSHDPVMVLAAYGIAAGASALALRSLGREDGFGRQAAAALILGLAIAGMHFTGMAGMTATLLPGAAPGEGGLDRLALALAVASGTTVLLGAALAAAVVDRSRKAAADREAESLRRSEQQLRAILEQMPFGVLVAEAPSGAIRYGNAEAARLMGHSVIRAATPADYAQYASLHPDGRALTGEEHALARAVAGERVDREHQLYRRDDGEVVNLEVSAAPIRDEAGQVVLGVVTFQDVTAAMQAQTALGRAQRMEAVGQLTGGVAHDFNNLLTAVMGSVSMALKRVDDEGVRRLLDNALQGAQRGAKLTAQLLAFSRRQRLETRAVDVNAMIEGMRDLLTSTLGGGVRIEIELKPDLPPAKADPTQLELAVLNLAINARDAMPGGGVLTVSTSTLQVSEQVDPHAPEPGRYVVVCVLDTGTGMPAEVLGKVFEPFFTTKPVGKGSGLGLSQVLGLAKQMGGGVRVETAAGQGAKVSIYLPEAEEAPARDETATPAPSASVAGLRILVVDDDADVRRYVNALLTEAGCEVSAVDCGAEALARLRDGPAPDVVLVDFAMPDMNGLETAEAIETVRPGTPVLILTGYADLEALPPGLDRGRLLQKPFEAEVLLARIGALARR